MNTKLSNQSVAVDSGIASRKFCKARTIADRLGLCPKTIFRWANDGKIARHKINARVVLFDEGEVIAFVESARIDINLRHVQRAV